MRFGERGRLFLALLVMLAVVVPASGALAQRRRPAPPETASVVRDTIWLSEAGPSTDVRVERGFVSNMFERGGPVMYGILACSLAGLAIVIVKLFQLRSSRV